MVAFRHTLRPRQYQRQCFQGGVPSFSGEGRDRSGTIGLRIDVVGTERGLPATDEKRGISTGVERTGQDGQVADAGDRGRGSLVSGECRMRGRFSGLSILDGKETNLTKWIFDVIQNILT